MNEPCEISWCDRPVVEGWVCMHCANRLERALGDVPALWEQLDLVLTRRVRYSDPEGRAGAETALPFNAQASELGWVLRNTLSTWCRLIAEERGKDLPSDGEPPTVAVWMMAHVTWLRHHRAGAETVEEVTSVVNQIRRAVDRPAERIYAGPCDQCGGDLYGKPDAATVECRPCGIPHDVAEMLQRMRSQVYGRLVTAKEGAVLLSRFGLTTTQGTIDKWHFRKRITSPSHDAEGRRLYLFDTLMALASQQSDTPSQQAS